MKKALLKLLEQEQLCISNLDADKRLRDLDHKYLTSNNMQAKFSETARLEKEVFQAQLQIKRYFKELLFEGD